MLIRNIPRLKQINSRACGPAALQMVLAHLGQQVSQRKIIHGVGGLKKYGVQTIQLANFVKGQGLKVECLSYNRKLAKGIAKIEKPSRMKIFQFLRRRVPVILAVRYSILQDVRNPLKDDQGHFIVITGHANGIYHYNDPEDGRSHSIKEDDLLFAWHSNVLDSSGYLLAVWK